MKKLIALILIALMALTPALAEWPEPEATTEPPIGEIPLELEQPLPQELPDREQATGEAIELEIDGQRVILDFDPSAQYSSIANGQVQASFYANSADNTKLYELYMIFPDTAASGMVITPDYSALTGEESSVVLIVSDLKAEQELYYFSSQMNGSVYPEDSTFSIAIDDIQTMGGATTFSGSLSATLIALDMATGEAEDTLEIDETPFSFSIGGETDRPQTPAPTTLPDDMRKT